MNKLTLVSCLMLIVTGVNIKSLDASSTSCEFKCFFECMFVSSPCKTDDCPCPDEESTGNSTSTTDTEVKPSSNLTESSKSNNKMIDSFSVDKLKSYMSNGSGQSTNGSTSGSGSFDYSQYTKDGSSGSSDGTNKTGSTSSGYYDYSEYNTEPATIPSNPNGGFDYSEYNTPPTTIPKNGGGSA